MTYDAAAESREESVNRVLWAKNLIFKDFACD